MTNDNKFKEANVLKMCAFQEYDRFIEYIRHVGESRGDKTDGRKNPSVQGRKLMCRDVNRGKRRGRR